MALSTMILAGQLLTADQTKIQYTHYKSGHERVIVIAHGFFNNKQVFLMKHIAESLKDTFDVIIFDFRGHGKSSGLFEWTSREKQDLDAVLKYAKEQKYKHIGVMGFSLGAAVALITSSEDRHIQSVIAVSPPYDFWKIDYHFWEPDMVEDLKLNMGKKGIGKGVRPGNPFVHKIKPIDIVSKVSPTPILFIHGDKDWLIKPSHSEKLFKKAKDPKRLEIISGAGHAERIYDTHPKEFIDLCMEWFTQTLK